MSLKIKFKIITPERIVYENGIDQATLPVTDGEVTILPNHRSYIASLKSGEIMLKVGKEEIHLAISGGFLELDNNNLIILADTAEHAEEIDLQRAEEARSKAEKLKKEKISLGETEFAGVASLVEKEIARIKVAKKHRTRKGMRID